MAELRYKVYFTPLLRSDDSTYASEIDVSDYIRAAGVGSIRRSIDASDYDVGVFSFSDVELTAANINGYFNEMDTRSIFRSTRDRCKVRVEFSQVEYVRSSSGTVLSESEAARVTFNGLINEEATRLDITQETIRFKVLSRDSVLRTTKISSGSITTGMTFSQCFFTILNVPKITAVLNVDALNINPSLDLEIDNGNAFNKLSVKEALDKLLLASNSAMLINDAGDIIIRDRSASEGTTLWNLYGKNDVHRRENILDITAYNTGRQRMFTAFQVNGEQRVNNVYVEAFGFKEKKIDIAFISDFQKEIAIADKLVSEWKTPKIELNCKIPTQIASQMQLLDRVSVSYPLRTTPAPGKFLPVCGIVSCGDTSEPLPFVYGSIDIPARIKFKVIEIEDNVETFTSIVKLRQAGIDTGDGYIDSPESNILGFAKCGFAAAGSGDIAEMWNPSVVGAAKLGYTMAG